MTITLTPELEAALAQEAKRLGKTPEDLAIEKLRVGLIVEAGDSQEQRRLHKALDSLLLAADKVEVVTSC